jgi:hypothetical protein
LGFAAKWRSRAIRAYVQSALCINGVQPATYILDPGAGARERIGLEIDITELNHASPGCPDEPTVLPLDASDTDGALRVVPDSEHRTISDLSCCSHNDSQG